MTTTTTVDDIMTRAGYEATEVGGQNWAWCKPTPDGSVLRIASSEYSLDGNPTDQDWYAGRHCEDGFVECNEFLTLADALALVERIPSPITPSGEMQQMLSRREIGR